MSDINVKPEIRHDDDAARMIQGNLMMLVSSLFFGINVPAVKVLIPDWLSAVDVTIIRFVTAGALIWLTSLFVKNDKVTGRDLVTLIASGAIGLFGFIYLFCLSLKYASPIDVSIILTLPPIFVILINAVIGRRCVTGLEIVGVILAFAGAAMVILTQHGPEGKSDSMGGDLIAVASSFLYSLYLVVIEKPTHKYKSLTLTRWVFLGAMIPCLIFIWHLPEAHFFHQFDWYPVALMIFIILGPTYLSYLLVSPSVKLIGSVLVSMYQYVIPVFATIASIVMGVAKLEWDQPVAMGIIIVGVIVVNIAQNRMRKAVQPKSDTV